MKKNIVKKQFFSVQHECGSGNQEHLLANMIEVLRLRSWKKKKRLTYKLHPICFQLINYYYYFFFSVLN